MATLTPTQTPVVDLIVNQGATFRRKFAWKTGNPKLPVDLTGAYAKLQVRSAAGNVLLELSTTNGGIVLGGHEGTVELYLSKTATSLLSFFSGSYDLVITMSQGDSTRFIQGTLKVSKGQTK